MVSWHQEKKDVLDALAADILHHYGRGRAVVAVDGGDGAGKTHFADDLAVAVRGAGHHVVRASIDSFLRPKIERQARGWDSPAGCYEDSYDYSTFRRVLVEPFRMGLGASFVTTAFDPERDAPVQTKWITAPASSLLVIDGVFLNRPELTGLWNYSVWLDAPDDVAIARFTARDGTDPSPAANERYLGAQRLYHAEASPRTRATAIIDNADFDHPRRVFADSC